jgi:hypothetical protein
VPPRELARRDIVAAWRGAVRYILEYLKDVDCNFSDDAKVHGGVLSVYMTKNTSAGVHSGVLLTFSARDPR